MKLWPNARMRTELHWSPHHRRCGLSLHSRYPLHVPNKIDNNAFHVHWIWIFVNSKCSFQWIKHKIKHNDSWRLMNILCDICVHADEQKLSYRTSRPIACSLKWFPMDFNLNFLQFNNSSVEHAQQRDSLQTCCF